jgi:hypothetical protein
MARKKKKMAAAPAQRAASVRDAVDEAELVDDSRHWAEVEHARALAKKERKRRKAADDEQGTEAAAVVERERERQVLLKLTAAAGDGDGEDKDDEEDGQAGGAVVRPGVNNVAGLNEKLEEIKLPASFSWIEVCTAAFFPFSCLSRKLT